MFTKENIKQAIGGFFGVVLSGTGIGLGDLESIVSIICSIIGLLITITCVVVVPVIKKIIAAKRNDGKIDLDESAEIVETLEEGLKQAQSDIDKTEKK